MTWTNFWSEAYGGFLVNLQDFFLGASPLDETWGVKIVFVMVFLDALTMYQIEWLVRPRIRSFLSHAWKDLLTFFTFGKMLCMWRWDFILIWCSSILLLLPLDEIDEISILSSLGGTCSISSSMSWVRWCILGFIFSKLNLPYITELGRLGVTIRLLTRLALSPLDDDMIWLCHSFCLRDLLHLCMSPLISVFHGLGFVITWCDLLYPWPEAPCGLDFVAIPWDLSIHTSFLERIGYLLPCVAY